MKCQPLLACRKQREGAIQQRYCPGRAPREARACVEAAMAQERRLVNEAIQRANDARRTAVLQKQADDEKAQLEAQRAAAEAARVDRSAEPDAPNADLVKDKKKAKAEHLKVGPLLLGAPLSIPSCADGFTNREDVCVVRPSDLGFEIFVPDSKNPIQGAFVEATLVDHWVASVTFTFGVEPQRVVRLDPVAQLESDNNFEQARKHGQTRVAQAHKALRAKYGRPSSSNTMTYSNGYGAKVRDVDDQEWLLPGLHVSYKSGNHDDVVVIELDTVRRQRQEAEKTSEAKAPTF